MGNIKELSKWSRQKIRMSLISNFQLLLKFELQKSTNKRHFDLKYQFMVKRDIKQKETNASLDKVNNLFVSKYQNC